MAPKKLAPVHAGEVLLEEFLAPMEISQYRLAKDISVSARRINEIVHGSARSQRTQPCDWLGILVPRRGSG